MDKENKTFTTIILAFMIISLFNIFSMKNQINNLEREISRIHNSYDGGFRDIRYEISTLRNDLFDKIHKGESMLASYDVDAKYNNGRVLYTVDIVPKEKQRDEKIFVSIGANKEEAMDANSSSYIATFDMEPDSEIKPLVTIESSTGVRQEVLPNTYLDELFCLEYDLIWNNRNSSHDENGKFSIFIYANNENSTSLLRGEPKATVVIIDTSTDLEIDRIKMDIEGNYSGEDEPKTIKFNGDLSAYVKKEGRYEVFLELETEDGLDYRELIAAYSNQKISSSSSESMSHAGGSGMIYPIWNK